MTQNVTVTRNDKKKLSKQQKSAPNNKNLLKQLKSLEMLEISENSRFSLLTLLWGDPTRSWEGVRPSVWSFLASTGRDLFCKKRSIENIKFPESYNPKCDRNTKRLKYFLKQLKSAPNS